MKAKNVGMGIQVPKKECDDQKCPFHGHIKLRGFTITGTIVSKDIHRSCSVEWRRKRYLPKYERYEKRMSKVRAHLPKCLDDIKVGDTVKLVECRPLSKTKNFIIVGKTAIENKE